MKIMILFLSAVTSLSAAEKPNIVLIYAEDLGETMNLAAAMPEKLAEMKALLETLITEGRSTPGTKQPNDIKVVRYPK